MKEIKLNDKLKEIENSLNYLDGKTSKQKIIFDLSAKKKIGKHFYFDELRINHKLDSIPGAMTHVLMRLFSEEIVVKLQNVAPSLIFVFRAYHDMESDIIYLFRERKDKAFVLFKFFLPAFEMALLNSNKEIQLEQYKSELIGEIRTNINLAIKRGGFKKSIPKKKKKIYQFDKCKSCQHGLRLSGEEYCYECLQKRVDKNV